MNWIGGHLQRYSRPNASTRGRIKKRTSARYRRRIEHGWTPRQSSHFYMFKDKICQRTFMTLQGTNLPASSPVRGRAVGNRGQGWVTCQVPGNSIDAEALPSTPRHPPTDIAAPQYAPSRTQRSLPRPKAPTKSLNEIKRGLLANADWARIEPTKAVKMNFSSAEEMKSIGRRKRLIAQGQKKGGHNRALTPYHDVSYPVFQTHTNATSAPFTAAACSVRVGSHIYQTETTRKSDVRSSQSSSRSISVSDYMLLNGKDPATAAGGDDDTIGTQDVGHRHERLRTLVPLNELRDLSTWDEVMARASSRSLIRPSTPLSTPLMNSKAGISALGQTSPVQNRPASTREEISDSARSRCCNTGKSLPRLDVLGRAEYLHGENPNVLNARPLNGGSFSVKFGRAPHVTLPSHRSLELQVRSSSEASSWSGRMQHISNIGPSCLSLSNPPSLPSRRTRPNSSAANIVVMPTGQRPPDGEQESSDAGASKPIHTTSSVVDSLAVQPEQFPIRCVGSFCSAEDSYHQKREQNRVSGQRPQQESASIIRDYRDRMPYDQPSNCVRPSKTGIHMQSGLQFDSNELSSEVKFGTSTKKGTVGTISTTDFNSPARVAASDFNTTLFKAGWTTECRRESGEGDPDILARYSPMAGVIGQALKTISVQANSASSQRERLPRQGVLYLSSSRPKSLKRPAAQAFLDADLQKPAPQQQGLYRQPLPSISRTSIWDGHEPGFGRADQACSLVALSKPVTEKKLDLDVEALSVHKRGRSSATPGVSRSSALSPIGVLEPVLKRHENSFGCLNEDTKVFSMSPPLTLASHGGTEKLSTLPDHSGQLYDISAKPVTYWMDKAPQWRNERQQIASAPRLRTLPRFDHNDVSVPLACRSALAGFKMLPDIE